MTDLECNVNSCVYNCSNLCSRNSINVGGTNADKKAQTCCTSYQKRPENDTYNSIRSQLAQPQTEITCSAYKCVFNKTGKCDADDICVDCCSTCDPCCESETQCASFRAEKTNHMDLKNGAY